MKALVTVVAILGAMVLVPTSVEAQYFYRLPSCAVSRLHIVQRAQYEQYMKMQRAYQARYAKSVKYQQAMYLQQLYYVQMLHRMRMAQAITRQNVQPVQGPIIFANPLPKE